MVHKYFPEPATIAVSTIEGDATSGVTVFPAVQWGNPSLSYTRSGQVTVSSSAWTQNTYQCQITHNSTNIQKTIPKGCTSQNPSVKLSQGSCPGENNLKQVQLVFHMLGLSSEEIQVKWFLNEKETPLVSEITSLGTSNGRHSFLGNVNISLAEWNSGAYYTVKVKDIKADKVAEDMIRKCSDNIDCLGINVFINRPAAEDLFLYGTPRLTCLASNIPKSTGYQFNWTQEGGRSLPSTTEDPIVNMNGTYSVTSVLAITNDAWYNGMRFTCTFTFTELSSPIMKTIYKDTESTLTAPLVSIYPPSSEELSKKEKVTLGCLAYGFKPDHIFIGWLQNNEEIPKDYYVNTDAKAEVENKSFFDNSNGAANEDLPTYFMYSKLVITYETWMAEKQFTCAVGHESNKNHLIQQTVNKNTENLWRIPRVIIEEGKNIDESQEDSLQVSATFVSLFILSLAYCVMVTFFKVK